MTQIPEASPYLVQKFASEAHLPGSRLADDFMTSEFGYFDAEGELVPCCGNDDDVIRLDAFLSYYLTKEALRRGRDACRLGY